MQPRRPADHILHAITNHIYYDRVGGTLRWMNDPDDGSWERRNIQEDDLATRVRGDGLNTLYIECKSISATLVAAFLRDGKWPKDRVFTLDMDNTNLRPENLSVGAPKAGGENEREREERRNPTYRHTKSLRHVDDTERRGIWHDANNAPMPEDRQHALRRWLRAIQHPDPVGDPNATRTDKHTENWSIDRLWRAIHFFASPGVDD